MAARQLPSVTSPRHQSSCDRNLNHPRRRVYQHLRQGLAEGLIGPLTGAVAYGLPNLINHGCHWYDTLLMLLGDPEPIWISGFVDDVSPDPADSRRRLDPPGRGHIGLANGLVASIRPEGGPKQAFELLGETGRLLILNDGAEVYLWRPPMAQAVDASEIGMQALDLPISDDPWPAGPAAVRDLVQAIQQVVKLPVITNKPAGPPKSALPSTSLRPKTANASPYPLPQDRYQSPHFCGVMKDRGLGTRNEAQSREVLTPNS